MFKADNPSVYIPSKSIAIKPDVVSDAVQNDQVRINIPSFVGFIDPNQTYLKYNMVLENVRGMVVPDRNCGGHAVIRNIQYRDGNNQSNIEMNEDYNANYSMMSNYNAQDNIQHKRELFEGFMKHEGDAVANANLYYGARQIAGGADNANPDTSQRPINKPTIQLQLNSGIFKQGKILPVSAMNGLKITIDTEDMKRAFQYLNLLGDSTTIHGTKITLTTAGKTAGDDQRGIGAGVRQFSVRTDRAIADHPFDIGDQLYVSDDAAALTNEESLGFINGFFSVGGLLGITYTPNRNTAAGLAHDHAIGSLVYIKYAERMVAHTCFSPNDGANVATRVIPEPSYKLNDIEMLVQSVQPPEGYANGLLKASQSAGGIQFDIMTYELYRHNQSNTNGLLQAQIPTLAKRAKAVFIHPLRSDVARDIVVSSLTGIPDNAVNYEFIHGSKHFPSRLAPLNRYSQAVADGSNKNEALHTSELQKAIVNVGEKVHNLQKIAKHFVIARSLSKYGGTMDLSGDTLSVRVDYNAGAHTKLFNNYVYCLRRVMVKNGMTSASNQVEASGN